MTTDPWPQVLRDWVDVQSEHVLGPHGRKLEGGV